MKPENWVRIALAAISAISALAGAAQVPVLAQADVYVDPGSYPSTMPFFTLAVSDGSPVFIIDDENPSWWNAIAAVAASRNASNQQLLGAFILYLHYVKGLDYSEQTNLQTVLNTRDAIVAGYSASGLQALVDAQRAGVAIPANTALDPWLNVTRRMTTLGGAGYPAKTETCFDPRIPPPGAPAGCTPNVYCPPEHPCFIGCDGQPSTCWDSKSQLGAAFHGLLSMSLP
jgi:hypothetical protein